VTRLRGPCLAAALLFAAHAEAGEARAQEFAYRGFADVGVVAHPQEAPNDPTQGITDLQARFDPSLRLGRLFSLAASVEARIDSHDRTGGVSFWDRTTRRPALAVRSLAATLARGPVTLEIGKQFVRWGQSDIISPTDFFTPRDYLVTISSDPLATTSARFTWTAASGSLELVYTPRMTPSRMPLLDQRWVGLQAQAPGLTPLNGETRYPVRPQYGARWRHLGRLEFSASFFHGFNHLGILEPTIGPGEASVTIDRRFAAIRAWGADVAAPLPGLTLKAEAAWQQARSDDADDYGLWVVQAERQQAEWLLIGGYVGEWTSAERGVFSFSPDRGLARGVIARVSRTFEDGRSVLVETVTRQDGDGLYVKGEYTRGFAARWRLTLQVVVLRGRADDFLGQYQRNSFAAARTRYSY
jgi:hypothetical protein